MWINWWFDTPFNIGKFLMPLLPFVIVWILLKWGNKRVVDFAGDYLMMLSPVVSIFILLIWNRWFCIDFEGTRAGLNWQAGFTEVFLVLSIPVVVLVALGAFKDDKERIYG